MRWYTDLREIVAALGERVGGLRWLVTDLETAGEAPEFTERGAAWLISDEELRSFAARDIQVEWGVFTALSPGAEIDIERLPVHPYADGNSGFWQVPLRVQFPGAIAELVCFDCSLTLLITPDADLTRRFRHHFPEARDLAEYNASRRTD